MQPHGHVTFLDYLMAATRNEWRWIGEEETWDLSNSFPNLVVREYVREDVFRRDLARMVDLGYSVDQIILEADANRRVVYRIPDPATEPE